jgi:hypothetical protein
MNKNRLIGMPTAGAGGSLAAAQMSHSVPCGTSVGTTPEPRRSRLRWRVDIPSDCRRGPSDPPATENRQNRAEPVLVTARGKAGKDDGPDNCATDAVGRVSTRSSSHPAMIPDRQVEPRPS